MPPAVRALNRSFFTICVLAVMLAAAAIAIAALVVGIRSQSKAADVASQSKRTAECVNRVLGERAQATAIEQGARLFDTEAEVLYLRGKINKEQRRAAAEKYQDAQQRAADYRHAHPAGRC